MISCANRYDCIDCRGINDLFMVTNTLWTGLGLSYRDNLCLDCLTKRLGRRLTQQDLTDVPINRGLFYRLEDPA